MPIYEYRCDNCAHEFETIQKLSDAPLTKCPACSEESLRKKVSAAGFRLKGGGWYETDFKGGKKRNVAGESEGKAASSGGDASGKSDGQKTGGEKSSDAGKSSGSSSKTETSRSGSDAKSGSSGSKTSE